MKYISILLMMLILGCSAPKDKTTVTYGDWQTERFIVAAITENGEADLSKFQNGKLQYIKVVNPELFDKLGQEVTITYRKVDTVICTDHNCTLKETYEIK